MLERKVVDARGKEFLVPPPEVVPPMEEGAKRWHAMRTEFYGAPSGIVGRLLVAMVLGDVLGLGTFFVCVRSFGGADRKGSIMIAALVGLVGAFGGFRLGVRPPNYRLVGVSMRANRVCLVCGYYLRDVPRAADGCTVCPECGAAWSLGG